jgi:hypothetical protein
VNLDLTDVEVEALLHELDHIIDGARFPPSPHILTLKAIRAKLRPEPVREPLPVEALRATACWQKATAVAASDDWGDGGVALYRRPHSRGERAAS